MKPPVHVTVTFTEAEAECLRRLWVALKGSHMAQPLTTGLGKVGRELHFQRKVANDIERRSAARKKSRTVENQNALVP